jgi:hypothetical protein
MTQRTGRNEARAQHESSSERAAGHDFDLLAPGRKCSELYDALEVRVLALQGVIDGAGGTVPEAYESEALAGLRGVLGALRDLNPVFDDKGLWSWVAAKSPVMAYVSASYVWSGDVASDLRQLSERPAGATWEQYRRSAADSAGAYIAEFLEPLFRQLNDLWGSPGIGHPLQRVRAPVERLQSEIVSLGWEL